MTRFLRFTALLLALAALASVLCSCEWIDSIKLHLIPPTEAPRGIPEDNDNEYVALSTEEISFSAGYTPIRPRHSYQLLNKGQQELYDALYKNVREVYPDTDEDKKLYKTKQVIVDGQTLSTADIRVAAKALYDDNPEIFWLSSTIYQLTDTQAGYTAVQMRSVFSPEQISAMQGELDAVINAFYDTVPDGLSEYDREKYVHDFLIGSCEYDTETAANEDPSKRFNEAYMVYGALVLKKAVCEGYARAMQLLLNGLGVDCAGITGMGYDNDGSSELHMWNAVRLDGDWYYTDATWDDQLQEHRHYQYFNLDGKTIGTNHVSSPLMSELTEDQINGDETYSSVAMNIFLPECTATKYQYYRYACPHLSDYDGENIKESIYYAALEREPFITVYIDPEALDYDEAIVLLFKESPQYFFSYLSTVNEWLSDCEVDDSNVTYYTNKERSAVTVNLVYY